MKDRTPVLYALKKVAYDKAEFHVAIEKTEQFYNLSKDDKKALFIDVHGVLKHQYILKLEIDTIFPEFAMNDDSSMLLSIALFEMRRAKSEEERTNILNEIVETFKERGISLNDENIKKLIDESKIRFVIPDKYKENPFVYNSFVFNTPSWVIEQYVKSFGNDKALEILKSNLTSPNIFLSVNTRKSSIDEYKNDDRFECISSINTGYEHGGSLMMRKLSRASSVEEVVDGKLFAQDLSYSKALDALPLMQYYKAIHIGAKTGTTSSSLADRLSNLDGSVIVPIEDEKNLARAKGMYKRLGLTNVQAYKSSLEMIKVDQTFDSFDIAVVTPKSTHLGQMRRRPDVSALFSIDQLQYLNKTQLNMLTEASYFPRVGGLVEYIVPSCLRQEGPDIIEKFINDSKNVNKYKLVTQKTILPITDENNKYASDGLYFAILVRVK